MKMQSFKVLNGKAFVAKIVILLLVLVVIGYGLYYSNTKNDFVSESVTIANDSELKTMKVTIQVPDRFEQYLVEMNKYIFEGARNPLNNWKFVSREVTVYSRSEDIVIASAQAAAEQIDTQGGIPSAEVVYFKIVNKTAYILLAMNIDSWAGTSVSLAKIQPLVEKTLLQFKGIDSVVFGVAPGDSEEEVSRSYKRKSITVISPYGGEQLIIGNKYEIVWSSSSNSELVRLFLIPGNIPITSLSNAAAGFSSPFDWTIDKKIVPGKYKIEARQYNDYSDVPILIAIDQSGEFTITENNTPTPTPQPIVKVSPITVLSPNGGEQLVSGSTYQIVWSGGTSNQPVSISLLSDSANYRCNKSGGTICPQDLSYIVPVISNTTNTGSYTWKIAHGTPLGRYWLNICQNNKCDDSDAVLEIVPSLPDPLITIVSPNGGEQLASGSIHQIKWNYPNATSTSKVDLYLESSHPCLFNINNVTPCFFVPGPTIVLDKNIAVNTAYYWIVGTDIANNIIKAGYYQMKVCVTGTIATPMICDKSDSYFTILPSTNSSPRIEPLVLPNSPVTSYYGQDLEVLGFSTSTVTWQLVGGSLPPGLSLHTPIISCIPEDLDPCTTPDSIMFQARISGMPNQKGSYNFTVKASNETQSVTKTYSLYLY
jgi:hypothetical protein